MPSRPPSPDRVFQLLQGFQATDALNAAVELDLFTALDGKTLTAAALAKAVRAPERGVRILCDFLAITGLLAKTGPRYRLAPDTAAFLSRKSPFCLASATKFLLSDEIRGRFKQLAATIRRGRLPVEKSTVSAENPVWVEFARSMAPMMALPAQRLADVVLAGGPAGRVLDVAAGHGLFGVNLARRDRSATVTALDWKPVLAVARENGRKAGLGGRHRLLPGDAFKVDWGRAAYDTVLLTNFVHHFDERTNVRLLRKAHAALVPGGRVVLSEFVPNPDRVTPAPAAAFSLVMLSGTPGGDAYTHAELDGMLRKAGFGKSRHVRLDPTPQSAVLAAKP